MKPLVSFSSMLRAELYKTLRNGRILMILLSPLAIYLLLFFYVTYKGREGLFNYTMPVYEGDPWLMLWSRYTLPFFSLIIPIAVVTLSYLICEIEFQNDNIRALFAHSYSKVEVVSFQDIGAQPAYCYFLYTYMALFRFRGIPA